MEVSRYTVNLKCYPRSHCEFKHLHDISQRLDLVWKATFRKSCPTSKHDEEIIADLQSEMVEIFVFGKNIPKTLSTNTGYNIVLKEPGINTHGSKKYDDIEDFLAENKHLLKSTTIMVVPNDTSLIDVLVKLPCKIIIMSELSKKNLCTPQKTYEKYINVKVSSKEKVAEDIGSMLEITAFEPMKNKFKKVQDLLQIPAGVGKERLTHMLEKSCSGDNIDKATLVRLTRSQALLSITEGTVQPEKGRTFQSTLDDANGQRAEKGIKRKSVALKEHIVLSYDIYVRQTRSGKLLSPPAVKTWTQEGKTVVDKVAQCNQQTRGIHPAKEGDTIDLQLKFTKNKPKFQRLLGEMVGMYKRSKLPEDCKPSLKDIPKEKVSQEMLSDLYSLSGSIKGYGYQFGTRLQICVLEAETEKLKQKISETLEMHGIARGSYDIVPLIDKGIPYRKLQAGAQVKMNDENYGTLTGFVKMQKGQQGEDSCAIASKHVLNGRNTIELANEEVKISADVLPETAPGDNDMLFDIALAKVKKDDEKHCEGHFENESGTAMKGMVCSYSDGQLEGKYVHINGASTEKGLGIISMTHYEMRKDENEKSNPNMELNDEGESNQIHIVVEDRNEDDPFCKEGDSGSMVCAEDEEGNHVQLISTVIGKRTPNSYQTLRLTKGLTHLERQTKSKISFFE